MSERDGNMSNSEKLQDYFCEILHGMPNDYWFQLHSSIHIQVYPGWKSKVQNNDDLNLLYVCDGEGCYHMQDGTNIPLHQGVLVFISHGVGHYASTNLEDPVRIAGLRFGIYDHNGNNVTKSKAPAFYHTISPKDQNSFFDLTWRIHQLFHKRKDPVSITMCSTMVYQLMFYFYEWLWDERKEKEIDKKLERVRQILEKNPFKKVSIALLAKETRISIRYLQKGFKEAYGFSPKEYHMNIKMNMALTLLIQEGLSATETAEKIGYSDLFIFSKQFKKHFGYSPTQAGNRY